MPLQLNIASSYLFQPNTAEIEKIMQTREQQIEEIKLKMNSVEDVVFSSFCTEIGVRNIRQYEDRELRAQEERKQKRLEFQKQMNRITSNLEFERSRDTQSKYCIICMQLENLILYLLPIRQSSDLLDNVSRWERTVNDEEERLEACKKAEQKQREEIDKDSRQVEELKAKRLSKRQECDSMDEDMGKARREVGAIAKDIQAAQKQVVSLEGKIESKKSERHNILMQCKMDDIAIPMLFGNMEDIVQQDPTQSSASDSINSSQLYERESR